MSTLETASPENAASLKRSTERFSHRAVLAAAGIGFAIGVIITLAVSPLFNRHSGKIHGGNGPMPTAVVLPAAQIKSMIRKLSDEALSFSYTGKQRVQLVSLVSDVDEEGYAQGPRLYDARIEFALNPNPAGSRFQVGGAESDCFLVLKALYSHDLPLQYVELIGTFHSSGGRVHGLRAGSSPFVESKFAPWKSLARTETKDVWTYLTPHWISRAFKRYALKPST